MLRAREKCFGAHIGGNFGAEAAPHQKPLQVSFHAVYSLYQIYV